MTATMPREEALAKALRMEAQAAKLAEESRALLVEADNLRAHHLTGLERRMLSAAAEVRCWSEAKRERFFEAFEINRRRA